MNAKISKIPTEIPMVIYQELLVESVDQISFGVSFYAQR